MVALTRLNFIVPQAGHIVQSAEEFMFFRAKFMDFSSTVSFKQTKLGEVLLPLHVLTLSL